MILLSKIKIILDIGGSKPTKRYPIESYIDAMSSIDANFIIVGGKNDIFDGQKIESEIDNCINLAGQLSLDETAAVMSKCDLYIGNDTSSSHMAEACHKPGIVLMSESKDKEFLHSGAFSSFCRFRPSSSIILRPEHALGECATALATGGCVASSAHCITQITPDEIIKAYNKIVKQIKH